MDTSTGNVLSVTAGSGANTIDLSQQFAVSLNLSLLGSAQSFDALGNKVLLSGVFQSVLGTAGSDTLTAASGASISGGGGNDLLQAFNANNITLSASSGQATFNVTGGSNVLLLGGKDTNLLSVIGTQNATLIGGSGNNDSLIAGAGSKNVSLVGGSGSNDSLVALGANVSLIGGSGNNNSLVAGAGSVNVSLIGGSGNNDSLLALGANVSLIGGSGNNNSLIAGAGSKNVSLVGGSGSNDSLLALGANVSLIGGSGNNNSLVAGAGSVNVSLVGGSGSNDSLLALGANASLIGGSGNNNSLVAGGGSRNVSLVGGSGNNNSLIAGSGSVNVSLIGGSGNNASLVAGGGSHNVSLVGGSGSNDSLVALSANVTLFGGSGNNASLVAGAGSTNVSLVGGSGNNHTLVAEFGAVDVLAVGGSGNNDSLVAHGRNVSLVGGSGNNDSLVAGSTGVNILLFGGSGNNDSLVAQSGSLNVLAVGGSGSNDSLVARGGNVSLVGGSGNNNSLIAGAGAVNVILVGGSGGNDSLVALAGSTNISLIGGSGNNNSLVAGAGSANVSLVGGSGNGNTLVASGSLTLRNFSGGSDTLIAGAANVSLVGGSGNNDSLVAARGIVSVIGGSGGDVTLPGVSGATNVSLLGGSGNNNSLFAGAGSVNVSLVGGSGHNDSLVAGANSVNVSLIGGSGSNASLVAGAGSVNVLLVGGSGNNDSLVALGGGATPSSNVSLIGGSGSGLRLSVADVNGAILIGGFGNKILLSASGTSTGVIMIGGFGNDDTLTAGSGVSNSELIGGFGNNDSLSATGSNNLVLVGGFGNNDTLTASGGSNLTLLGGYGNFASLSATGVTNAYLLGQSGNNDSLVSTNGRNVSLVGGSGSNLYLADTGSTHVSLLGGSGSNDSLISVNGTNVTLFGGNGANDSISATGGINVLAVGGTAGGHSINAVNLSNATLFGGAGNFNRIATTGGSNVLSVGGTGYGNSLSDTNGSADTLVNGGNQLSSLLASGGDTVRLFGGGGTDFLSAIGGSKIGLFGENGDNTYTISGTAANPFSGYLDALGTVGLDQSSTDQLESGMNTILFPVSDRVVLDLGLSVGGAATALAATAVTQQVSTGVSFYLIGLFQGVVGSATGNDFIRGNALPDSLVAGGGNATLMTGAGGGTLVSGSGNDLLIGGGRTTYAFRGAASGHATISQSDANNADTIDLSKLSGPATLNLASTADQAVTPLLTITLVNPTDSDVIGSAVGNNITGNSRDNHITLSTGNNTVVTGTGLTTLKFTGSSLGTNVVTASALQSVGLNFHQLGAPVSIDLANATQAVAGGTISFAGATDGRAVASVVGTVFNDTLLGNPNPNAPGVSLYGGGGRDSIVAGSGDDFLQAGVPQLVFLDFDTYTPLSINSHVYTQYERDAIQRRMEGVYSAFRSTVTDPATSRTYTNGFVFTQSLATARLLTRGTGGEFVTLFVNKPPVGGQADQVDFGNADLGGTASVDASLILGRDHQPDPTTANYIAETAGLAEHELAHLAGLRHTDSFGPIGSGGYQVFLNGTQVAGLNPNHYFPIYQQPATALAINASANPILAGTSIPAGATAYGYETALHVSGSPASVGITRYDTLNNLFFGEREAIRLAFDQSGVTILAQTSPHGAAVVAQDLGTLPGLVVPNTLAAGSLNFGKSFAVTALAVVGSIGLDANGQSRSDWYSFAGRGGDSMSFETISNVLPGNTRPLDTIVRVYDSAGNLLAMNDDELESKDSLIQDFLVPADGKYFVQVDTYAENPSQNTSQGHYILSITGFQIGASLGGGSTLVAGPGSDILYGGQGNNLFRMAPNIAGSVTVIGGNGADVLDQSAAPLETVTYLPSANSAPISRIYANPPAIAFPAGNITQTANKGGQVSFSAELTGYPGRGLTYSLATVSGGQYPTGATIRATDGTFNWSAGDQGTYQVRIVATASDGSSATTTLTITVNVVPPVLNTLTAQTAPVGTAVILTGHVAKPVATDVYLYGWVVTDSNGQTVVTAASQTLSFNPGVSGTFTATATATDTQDGQTSSTSTAITITEVTPIVAPLPSAGVKAGQSTQFIASYSYPGSVASLTLTWTVTNSDGQSVSTGTGSTFLFAAPDAGVYTVTFSVRTASGVTGSASATVTATGVPPTATPPAGVSLSEGTTVALAFTYPYSPASAVTAAGFRYSFAVSPALLATTYAAAGTSASYNFTGADVGTFTVYGRIIDKNNQSTDYATPVVVTAVQLVPTGGGSFTAIKNSSTGALTLAAFTDPGGADATSTYAASIDWGDGTAATAGSVVLSGNAFGVSGSHTYATQGSYTMRVSLSHDGLPPVVVSDSVTVSAPALVGTGGFNPSGTKAADTGTVTLATFTDPTGPDAFATYSATINWGDGTTGAGAISSPDAGGKYTVTGSHTYTTTGTKTVVVTLRHDGSPDATATDTATIINPVLVAQGVGVAATRNSPTGQVTVATFTDPAGPDALANYSAVVNWGDGTAASAATVTLGSDGRTFGVAAGHTYAAQGSYPITVTVAHGAAPPAPTVATTTATVSNPAVSPTFTPFVGIQNVALTNQRVATFTDPSGADATTAYTATVNWGDGTATTAGTIGAAGGGVFAITGSHTYTTAGTFTVTITVVHGSSPPASTSGTATINNGKVTATGTSAPFVGALPSTAVVATFTDPNGAALPSAYSATIAWGDGQSSAGVVSSPVSGVFSVSGTHTYFDLGSVPVSVTITRGTSAPATVASTANVGTSIFALNPTLSGAVSLSGSPVISIDGALVIDSNSNTALIASGSPRITAGSIRIVGGYSTSGSPSITPTPIIHVVTVADPLASLAVPVNPGGTPINATISGSQTVTLNPGLYSQISISGSARVTLNPGVYVIAGNFTVSGSSKLTGSGVLLFMAGSSYLNSHAYGGISFSGSPVITLTPMSTGTYAGITMFQARDNNRAISFSGSAQAGINGFVYAPNALLTLTGSNTTVRMGIIVDRLSTSGSSTSGQTTGGSGTEDGNPAGELLSTNLSVYVNDPFGHLTAAERNRIHDAIVSVDALTAPYLIDVVEVTDPADANVVIDLASTSVLGGVAQGVLAAYDPTNGEITIIDGWNWYDGTAAESIGASQFDFQTVVTHELGHALGLSHMPILTSVMYGSLTPGLAKRSLITADLNVGNDYGLPGALHADLSGLLFEVPGSPVGFEIETSQRPSITDLSPLVLVPTFPTASRPVALDFPRVAVSVPPVSRSESTLQSTPATATVQVFSMVPDFEPTNQPPVAELPAKLVPEVAADRRAARPDRAPVVPTQLPPAVPASQIASPAEDILDTWPEMSHWLDMLKPVPVSTGFDGDNVELSELVLVGLLTGAAAAIGGLRREEPALPELRPVRPT